MCDLRPPSVHLLTHEYVYKRCPDSWTFSCQIVIKTCVKHSGKNDECEEVLSDVFGRKIHTKLDIRRCQKWGVVFGHS